tara:strand:- start:800 stop:943 length:144 start_codon:yes stop_codon:yes gene_type:complete
MKRDKRKVRLCTEAYHTQLRKTLQHQHQQQHQHQHHNWNLNLKPTLT